MKVTVPLQKVVDNSYEIVIGPLGQLEIDAKVAIVTNPKVSGLHLNTLLSSLSAKEVIIITVPDGEVHKSMQTIEFILDRLFEHKFDRKSMLIAFGGGVVGDMTGFAASLFGRGIDFIQIPTTLLSQVDSSVGGKTGVNNRFGKNLIGAFYQPKAVYIDPSFLATLPKRELAAGAAEVIKMAVMFDATFFEWLKYHELSLLEHQKYAIKRSIELKSEVVSKDEKEKGIRAVLNYGHTFGHVIERESNYSGYLHGEAVAIGMVMANTLAMELGLMSEAEHKWVLKMLHANNLPTDYLINDVELFYDAFFLDKKSRDDVITFILPKGIGDFEIRNDVDKSVIIDVLETFS